MKVETMNNTTIRLGLRRYIYRQPGSTDTQLAAKESKTKLWGLLFIIVIVLVWVMSPMIGFVNALITITILGFSAAIVGLRWPVIGLLGIGILATLDPLTRVFLLTGGILRWNTLNYWLVLVILLFFPFLLRLNDLHSRILQVFILLLGVELLISPLIAEGVQEILNIVIIFGLIIYFARAAQDQEVFYWLGVTCGVLAAVGGAVYYLQSNDLPYIDPNAWALFPLTALFAICIGFYSVKDDRRKQLILLILVAMNCVWIFLSASRGNMITALVCLLYIFLTLRNLSWRIFVVIVSLVVGYWLSIQFFEQQSYALYRIEKLFDPSYTLSQRTSGRARLTEAGMYLFSKNPFGIGTGGFLAEASNAPIMQGYTAKNAHSAWIKILSENGIPGIILLTAYVISFSIVGWRKRHEGFFFIGLLVTTTLAIKFISSEFQGTGIWFLAAGAAVLLNFEMMVQSLKGNSKDQSQNLRVLYQFHHGGGSRLSAKYKNTRRFRVREKG